MICSGIRDLLFLHAHDELSGLSRLVVGVHLRRCPSCRLRWEGWSCERHLWRGVLAEEPGQDPALEGLRAAVASRILAEEPVRSRTPAGPARIPIPPRPRVAVAVLAVLLALALSAVAAFGPAMTAGARRWWHRAFHPPVACDQVPRSDRTPPGGTEDPSDTGSPRAR